MKLKLFYLLFISLFALVNCSQKKDNGSGGPVETVTKYDTLIQALAEATIQANSTEESNSYRSCDGSAGALLWNDSPVWKNGAKYGFLSGRWSELWVQNSDCNNGFLLNGNDVLRTTTSSLLTLPSSGQIKTDTLGGVYQGITFENGGVKITRLGESRTVEMSPSASALHKTYTDKAGSTLFDFYIQLDLTITGTQLNRIYNGLGSSSRTINGTVLVYDATSKYIANNLFSAVTWGDESCCYPTNGMISTSFSGENIPANSSVLTFTNECGIGNLTFSNNSSNERIELKSCQ